MLLLAKVPQTGQFVCSCLAPKHLASARLGYCLRDNIQGDVFIFYFSNWIEEDFYVLQLCLMVTGMIGMLLNWVLAQSCYFLSCFIIANCCCLLFVSHSRCLCSVVQRSVLSRHPILPADSNSGTTEFGLNSIFSLCNEQWIHACLHGH